MNKKIFMILGFLTTVYISYNYGYSTKGNVVREAYDEKKLSGVMEVAPSIAQVFNSELSEVLTVAEIEEQARLAYIVDGGEHCWDLRQLRPVWVDSTIGGWGGGIQYRQPFYLNGTELGNDLISSSRNVGLAEVKIALKGFKVSAKSEDLEVPNIKESGHERQRYVRLKVSPRDPSYQQRSRKFPSGIKNYISKNVYHELKQYSFGSFSAYGSQENSQEITFGEYSLLDEGRNLGCRVLIGPNPFMMCGIEHEDLTITFDVPWAALKQVGEIADRFELMIDNIKCNIQEDGLLGAVHN